jgi:N-acetylglucosamine malate deacetylase 1
MTAVTENQYRNGARSQLNVLVVAAHPDDELLGVGGTVASHVAKGDRVKVIVMCEGVSVRYSSDWDSEVRKQSRQAAQILGVTDLVLGNLPDQQLDTLPLCDLVKNIEQLIADFQADVVYTHFAGDINRDHRVLAEAVLVAARPYSAPSVREILMFETPSSTEWGSPQLAAPFQANVCVDISNFLEQKIRAFSCYSAEVRPSPHPRSLEALADRARYWGSVINRPSAEAFVLVRSAR